MKKNTLLKKNAPWLFGLFVFAVFTGCKEDNQRINSARITNLVEEQIKAKPLFESATLKVGKLKLRTDKDREELESFRQLEAEGLIEFTDDKIKKRFLAKDSLWKTNIRLTEKSMPYVLDQNNDKVQVKTMVYEIDHNQEFKIDYVNKKKIGITVLLLKKPTPFFFLMKDANPNVDFITKKYKLKYFPKRGWEIVP